MGTVTPIRSKTDQRVIEVMSILKNASGRWLVYDDIRKATGAVKNKKGEWKGGTHYDILLYILTTLTEVGLVERENHPQGPGRPRVSFRWIGAGGNARAVGARKR